MKNNKQFLSILISVLICVFVFGIIVYVTTTIGNDVTVGGALTAAELKFDLVDAPTACTATLASTASGNINNGTHTYYVTFVTAVGETSLGTASNTVTVDSSHKQVVLSSIPIGSSDVTQRKIYRTDAGATGMYLLATLGNNTEITYTDNIADASLGTEDAWGLVNTTGAKITINGEQVAFLPLASTVALGYGSLQSLTMGYANIAIGMNTLAQNTTGYDNIAIGTHALSRNVSGHVNLAIGASALSLLGITGTQGNHNVAIGEDALTDHLYGNNNVALGYGALYGYNFDATGSGNVALGAYAGYYESGSNKLFIDNAPRSSEADARLKALIYGIFASTTANQYLTINGQLQVSGTGTSYVMGNFGIGDTVPAYKLSVDGTASVSGTTYLSDTYFSGVASVSSSGIRLDEGITITTGTASASGACGISGSLYIRTGQSDVDAVFNICGSDGLWNPADL